MKNLALPHAGDTRVTSKRRRKSAKKKASAINAV
jgi:hypothetical protein